MLFGKEEKELGAQFVYLAGFYENELTNRFLRFWLPRCEDKTNGGFFNCFDNEGRQLLSRDKYTWSQGRFVWIFAKLASIKAPVFDHGQRAEFLRLAGQGAEFLMKNCLIAPDDWRCVFLMDESGAPKQVEGYTQLDMSLYADCFVIAGLALYSVQAKDRRVYSFCRRLYESACDRLEKGNYNTLPYPLSEDLRAHGLPMIFSNISQEMYAAACVFEPEFAVRAMKRVEMYTRDVLENFVDENNCIHEVIRSDNTFFPQLLGSHFNPGHTIEDVWFMLDAARMCGKPEWNQKLCDIAARCLRTGWDEEFGGLLHFCALTGGEPTGDNTGFEEQPMSRQLAGWGDKLWWIHSEALYTSLRCYFLTKDADFLQWHNKVFEYTYRVFPNRDIEISEWVQIRKRNGQPLDAVVALPVKDPYHIMRNLILLLELLYSEAVAPWQARERKETL